MNQDGKVCLVTGAARGLGNLIARTFVESGANSLAVLDLNAEDARHAAKEISDWFLEHGQVSPGEIEVEGFGCDVSNEDNVMRVMAEVKERFGKIDVVVNSAGIVENFPATQYPTNKMKKLFDININGSYYVAREAAKQMLADGIRGSIILIASMSAGVVNVPQPQAPYNASKAAVRHLARSLAVEWAKDGIRVNSLSPGYMETSLLRTVLESSPAGRELKDTWENLTPQGRLGQPEDLKGAAIYLASDASLFTTAHDLVVDGGYVSVDCCRRRFSFLLTPALPVLADCHVGTQSSLTPAADPSASQVPLLYFHTQLSRSCSDPDRFLSDSLCLITHSSPRLCAPSRPLLDPALFRHGPDDFDNTTLEVV